MKSSKALFGLLVFTIIAVGAIAAINYSIDAQCYYTCPEINKERRTINTYYQVAQRILTFPDTEVIIIGSSRGETTLPLWIEKVTNRRTLNLSTSGAELATKKALLHFALQNAPVKKVIWLADYFELIDENQDPKIKKTPALRKYLHRDNQNGPNWKDHLASLQGLIDHNTTSASINFLKHPPPTQQGQGGTGNLDYQKCEQEDFVGKESPESLKTKINILYQTYISNVIRAPQNPLAWNDFKNEILALNHKKIEVIIVAIPYHPDFLARLRKEYPVIFQDHQQWVRGLSSLQNDGIRFLNYLDGIPDDDGTNKYWNDGVHFTCHSSIKMLKGILEDWKK